MHGLIEKSKKVDPLGRKEEKSEKKGIVLGILS